MFTSREAKFPKNLVSYQIAQNFLPEKVKYVLLPDSQLLI